MRAPYAKIAAAVLPGWEISLAFVSPAVAKSLNKKLRGKTYIPNVLSYEVGTKHGEVIICEEEAKKQAPSFAMSAAKFKVFLFIHALLHLKGYPHSATMERREQALLKKWEASAKSNVPTHRNRHRHRHVPGQTGSGRRAGR